MQTARLFLKFHLNSVVGLALVGYGIYAARQSSGVYIFPIYIFALPFIAPFLVVRDVRRRNRDTSGWPDHQRPSGSR
ncbi:hypothetical protein FAGKG844_700023 [Frankia sp. AgKG'84/4]